MKSFGHRVVLILLGFGLGVEVVCAQATPGTNAPTASTTTRNSSGAGTILLPELPLADPPSPAVDANFAARPATIERSLAPEVRQQLSRFRNAREAYLNDQARLEKLLKGANERERELIRQRIKESHEKWVLQARSFRDEANQRMRDLKRALPKHREALNEARPGQRGRQPAGLD